MPRKVFLSYHNNSDAERADLIRKLAVVNSNDPCPADKWSQIRKSGEEAIRCWIDDNQAGRSCTIVLVGSSTVNRKWIRYEIRRAWQTGQGVIGLHIHNLRNRKGLRTPRGKNPFLNMVVDGVYLGSIVKCYEPPFVSSKKTAEYIAGNLEDWVERAIEQRSLIG